MKFHIIASIISFNSHLQWPYDYQINSSAIQGKANGKMTV